MRHPQQGWFCCRVGDLVREYVELQSLSLLALRWLVANVALRSERASVPAITIHHIESSPSLRTAENTHNATAGMEAVQGTTNKPAGNPTTAPASSGSLWDAAYNDLRNDLEAAQRIDAYETLLRNELGISKILGFSRRAHRH